MAHVSVALQRTSTGGWGRDPSPHRRAAGRLGPGSAGAPTAACWCSTPRTSRSTSAPSAARPCSCSRSAPRSSSAPTGRSTPSRFTLPRPVVIRLITYVRIPRDAHRRKITRRAVFARDRWTCQYCGTSARSLTVDHVIPRSKGGASSWDNIVTCCAPCNRRKGDRLPQAGEHAPARTSRRRRPRTIFVHVADAADPGGAGAVPARGLTMRVANEEKRPGPARSPSGELAPARAGLRSRTSGRRCVRRRT